MWPTLAALAVVAGLYLQWSARRRCRAFEKKFLAERREVERLRDLLELAGERAQVERQALFNSMAEGFLLLDRAGHVEAINQTLENFFSLQSDPRGKSIIEVFRLHELLELWEQVQRDGQVRRFELEVRGPSNRFFEVSAAGLRGRYGGIDGGVFIFHDVTRLKQLENTRREFVANVSHELRTPLTLIKGFVETLLDGAMNDPEVMQRFLRTISKHTDRLTFLIEDLLTISRLESGQIILNQQEIALRPLVERVVEDLQSRAAEREITLINDVAEDIEVLVDADRAQQVLFNLIDNGIKYGHPKGFVQVGAGICDGVVRAWVKDNGPGIPTESVDRVFERFYRVDRARSRDQGGTGLGLAIVKHIVQLHGGKAWAESKPGQGSTFYLTLPKQN
jgi:two-component system, OmpR family, phosphate regulon sensor histidine kinase PhoR